MEEGFTVELTDQQATTLDLIEARLKSEDWAKIDKLEAAMEGLPQTELPLRHIFTPHLYTREIYMPGERDGIPGSGTLLTSRIHLYEHPFVISAGKVSVWDNETGWKTYQAPYTGVTKPGTRRVLYIHEDTIWSTFHVTEKTDPDEVIKEVTYTGGKYFELRGAANRPEYQIIGNEPKALK